MRTTLRPQALLTGSLLLVFTASAATMSALGQAPDVPAPEGAAAKPAGESGGSNVGTSARLANQQEQVAERFRDLERLLLRMAELTAPTDPKRAALLRQAVAQSKQRDIDQQFDTLVELLKQERLSLVVKNQGEVQQDLIKLLELLLSEDRGKRIETEKERVREYLKRVNKIIKDQKNLQGETNRDGEAKKLAERQGELADKTGELAGDLEADAEKSKERSAGGDQKSQSPKDGKQGDNEGEQSDKDGQKSEKSGDEKSDKKDADKKDPQGDGKKSDRNGDEKSKKGDEKDQDRSGDKSQGENSKGEKDQQGEKGEKGNKNEKGDQQGQQSEGKQSGKSHQGKSQQGKSQKGKPQQGKPQQGQPQQGEGQQGESGESGESQEQPPNESPAQKRLQQAQERMKEAQEKLEQAKRSDAAEKQAEALKELEQAKADLEEILRQLREEEMARMLAMLEARFRKMLDQQMEVYEGTKRLDKVAQEERDRDDEIEAGRLSRKEAQIAADADKALAVLREEGSAVAFPEAVTEMRDDMQTVVDRLAEAKVGELTQGVEKDIIAALEEMIASLKKAQKDMEEKQKQQGEPMPSGEDEQPLVDVLAELKMIRALQMRVNVRTQRYAVLTKTEQAETPELLKALKTLAEREQRIHKVTRDIVVGRNR